MAKIKQLKEQFESEWLAIAYITYRCGVPEEGELVAHSLDEAQVWRAIRGDHRKIYVTYTGPLIDEGMAIAISPITIWDEQN